MSEIDRRLFFQIFGSGDFSAECDGAYARRYDRQVIVSLARHIRPRTVIEYGVNVGRTAKVLLGEIECIERYIGIDAASKEIVPENQIREFPARAGELVGDLRLQIVLRPSEYQLPKADLVYIDGGHSYECVRRDTLEAMSLINGGGVILWHDYNPHDTPGVVKFIDENNADHRICLVGETMVCFKFY